MLGASLRDFFIDFLSLGRHIGVNAFIRTWVFRGWLSSIFHAKSVFRHHAYIYFLIKCWKSVDVVNSKTICKLTASWATMRHDDWHSIDSEGFPELVAMISRTLPNTPKPSRIKPSASKLLFFYPDWARSAAVSRSVKEGHGRVSKHRGDMPKHPEFANSDFGNPFGDNFLKSLVLATWYPKTMRLSNQLICHFIRVIVAA